MATVNEKSRITIQVFLLLLGLMSISIFFILPGYSYIGSPQKLPCEHSFILSEESPFYEYSIYGSDFGIASLLTNGTPVSIVIRHQDQVVFNATNIQEISDYGIELPLSSPYLWQLEVGRQDADVSVDLTTYHWAIAVAYTMPVQFLIFLIVGSGITFSALHLLFKSYSRITSDGKKGMKFLVIVMLLLIGTLLCSPLAKGTLKGDFTPRSTIVSQPDETYRFTLNETHPTSLLNLSTLYPEGELSVSIKLHSLTSSEYPFQLSVITNDTYRLTLEEESNDNTWWIIIPIEVNSTSAVNFERIDADLDVQFTVDIQYLTLTPREDIVLPAIFGVLGLFVIIGGFFIAYRFDN